MYKMFYCCVFLLIILNCYQIQGQLDELQVVHVIFRHGQRTPLESYPLDPYINETYYPYGRGKMTDRGKRQMLSLGKSLRKTYKSFLKEAFATMQAVDTPRTKLSAQLCMKELDCRHTSYTFTDKLHDRLMGPIYKICPTYYPFYESYLNGSGNVPHTFTNFLNFLSNQTGLEIKTVGEASDVLDIIFSQLDLGLKPPAWCNSTVMKLMNDVNNFAFRSFSATPDLKHLVGGPLLKKILDDSKENSRKMFLYSGHGETISALMSAMNITIDRPPYSSFIIIEVGQVFNQRQIRVLYQDYSQVQPKVMKISGCGNPCYLDEFNHLMENSLPTRDTCYNN